MNCQRVVSRGILARGVNLASTSQWRRRVAFALARGIAASNGNAAAATNNCKCIRSSRSMESIKTSQ